MKYLKSELLKQAMTSSEYRKLVQDCIANGKTTGAVQSQALIHYTKLNAARSRRIYKQWTPQSHLLDALMSINEPMLWLCITEAWCGDAAYYIPMLQKLEEASDKIELHLLLRDANPRLMDAFLTNGAKSIPKLILLRRASLEVLGVWGPRTQKAMEYRTQLVGQGLEPTDIAEGMQRWYLQDMGKSFDQEFAHFLASIRDQPHN